jgi:fibronectin-binding autotransporter adhesin
MKKNPRFLTWQPLAATLSSLLLFGPPCLAGSSTWVGAGADGKWTTPANWNTPPASGDLLIFTGTSRLNTTNTFTAGTAFGGFTFAAPAGGFALFGNSVSLAGGITNGQVVTPEVISLPLALAVNSTIDVVSNGALILNGSVSGSSLGLSKAGGGVLTLGTTNTFSGPLTVNGGTLIATNDAYLGAVPALPSAGRLVLNAGTLQTPTSFTINSNRGIALGPVGGSSSGVFDVGSGATVIYQGILANNTSAVGGLIKRSFGGLTLGGSNAYTGPTAVRNGTLTLDFGQATAPANNIIQTNSSLAVGGETAGIGQVNFAALIMLAKAGATNSQGFNGTLVDIGGQVIRATNTLAGSAANLALGPITHNPGGVVSILTPALYNAGTITTTTNSLVNGILGGWATISGAGTSQGITYGTNLATVDINGNIVNYTGYMIYAGAPLQATVGAGTNLLIDGSSHPGAVAIAITNDIHGAGSKVDVNTITFWNAVTGDTLMIGTNNTLRLGRFGGIFKVQSDTSSYFIGGLGGVQTGSGQAGAQGIGTLTAGGSDSSSGEIVFTANSSSGNSGGPIIEATIADNGTNKVTFVKAGPSTMKIDGHNIYSGGTYITQGRIQLSGPDLGGTPNLDGFGFGPVFIFPGGQFFSGGSATVTDVVTNDFFIAGNGTSAEAFGAIRTQDASASPGDPARFSGTMTLIGDTRLGGGATNDPTELRGRITGGFNLEIGSTANTTARKNGYILSSQANDWSGNFTILASSFGNGPVNTRVVLGTNDVIPDGFGKGNVILSSGFATSTPILAMLDLNGFNETVNGLLSAGIAQTNSLIYNSSNSSLATLTVGNNDQTAEFDGTIMNSPFWFAPGGTTALAKIGAGVQTLGATNTYSGDTTITAGTLALAGSGALPNSANIRINTGAVLDVSAETNGGFATANAVRINNGTLVGNTSAAGIGSLNLTNAQLTLIINPAVTNLVAGSPAAGGTTNLINITSVLGITSPYPTQFVVIKYTSFAGAANFGFGSIPSLSTQGYFTNDTTRSAIMLILTNGPKPLTWKGNLSWDWDVNTTLNWIGFGAPSAFNTADSLTFNDTANTNLVNVTTTVIPATMTVSNTADYTFFGSGAILGFGGLDKESTGKVTFLNNGGDGYRGGVTANGGTVVFAADNSISGGVAIASGATVQVGTNGGSGTLPTGSVVNNGALIFNRGADLTVGNAIAGSAGATLLKTNGGILALSGNNTFTGAVVVVGGVLQAGSATALGVTNNGTTVSTAGTLDVNGRNLGAELITVSGAGNGGNGAIVNNGADQANALRLVSLAGDTTLGGTGRWDIRESANGANNASLAGAFNITKVGVNQVTLAGVQAPALGNITVREGVFGIENGSVLGTGTLTVSNGATLEVANNGNTALHPVLVLNGNGATTTVLNNGGKTTFDNNGTVNGTAVFGGNGVELILGASLGGPGALRKTGSGQLTLNAPANYSGQTVVSNGTLVMDASKNGGAGITVYAGAALGGGGPGHTISENVTLNGGGIRPGNNNNVAQETLSISGNVAMNTATNVFDLTSSVNFGNDLLTINGNLTLTGTNVFRIQVVDHLSAGDTYTLVSYSGTPAGVDSSHIAIVPPTFGYTFALVDPTTTPGSIQIQVVQAIGFDFWVGTDATHPTFWDTATTTNWDRNGAAAFNSNDFACFSDADGRNPNPNSTNITLVGKLFASGTIVSNDTKAYQFTGAGSLSGGELILEGQNPVMIANSGSNDWTNGVLIDANVEKEFFPASLYVGDGSVNGNLGFGTITNDGILVFNHGGDYSNALIVSNNIVNGPDSGQLPFGNGIVHGITNTGSGVVVLGGASTFLNELDIVNGIVAAGSDASGAATPLGSTNTDAVAIATNNGTLDLNGHNLGAKQVIVSGAGKDGQGAIVNNGVQQVNGLQFITLAADTTFGGGSNVNFNLLPNQNGTNRWDLRSAAGGAAFATVPPGSPYNITKIGGGQFSIVGVTNIDPAISNIDIQGGSFAVQTSSANPGDPNGLVTIHTNAALGIWSLSNIRFNKRILVHGGGSIWAQNGTSTNIGPITLGTNAADYGIFQMNANLWVMNNPLAGPGGLMLTNGSTLHLASTNTYTGNTLLYGGTLALENTDLRNSPVIDLVTNTPILDVGGRADLMLTMFSGQTLQGAGIIRGSLTISGGATVAPGHSIGTISVTNAVTLSGQTLMEVDAGAVTRDQINCTNTITYGGTLVVSNINGTLAAGQSYRLFRAGAYNAAFSSVMLPTLTANLYWTNTLAADGTIGVRSLVIPHPVVTSVSLSGANVTLNATNGSPGAPFYVLAATNVSLPLSNWTVIATNTFDGGGNVVNYTVTNAVSGPQRFYLLQVP